MRLGKRHKQCIEALEKKGQLTAREVSEYIYNNGYTKVLERNIAHPRLNELVEAGYVEIVGKKHDNLTDKDVYVYNKR